MNNLAKSWCFLAISSLALAGIPAILLVIGRSPAIHYIIPSEDAFRIALNLHVNLSVLVWLVSVIMMAVTDNAKINSKIFVYLASIGVVIMLGSMFVPNSTAFLNNYIPMLDNVVFKIGLSTFLGAVLLQMIFSIISCQNIGTYCAGIIILVAFICLGLSFYQLMPNQDLFNATDYYERLFWGFGHVLQCAYVAIMLVAWQQIANMNNIKINGAKYCYIAGVLFAVPLLLIYIFYDITDAEHIKFFTIHMRHLGGVIPIIFAIIFVLNWRKRCKPATYHMHYLIPSLILFLTGGILGFMINQSNTIIPAHYHGSIIAITVLMMGWMLIWLERFGHSNPYKKLSIIQPYIYGLGALMHAIGLAVSGGYGALRKTPGAMESIEGKIAMGVMGMGGLLSVIGGIIFVVLCIKIIFLNKNEYK